MDPLSISASIVALLGAAGTVAKGLQKLGSVHHASNNLLALINEISDFQVVLCSLSSVVTQQTDAPRESRQVDQNLVKLLDRAKAVAQRTKETIDACLKDPDTGSKVSRRSWLRRQHSLKLLQEEVRTVNQSLSTSLSTTIHSDIRRIELKLEEVSVTTKAIRLAQGDDRHDVGSQVIIQPQQNVGSDVVNQLRHLVAIPLNHDSGSSPGIQAAVGDAMEQNEMICVKVSNSLFGGCRDNCRCQCHRPTVFQTPRHLKQLIGTLFLNYIGTPCQLDACSANCRRRMGIKVRVTYIFPHWFWMRKFSAIITNGSGGPHVSMRVSRQISPKSEIFKLCRAGDVEGVRRLFTDGQASPFDVSAQTGSTVLTHAIMGCHSDVCSFLINEGADPFAENVFGSRPIDDALDLILTSQLKRAPFEKYFLDGDYYDEKRFSMIHKVATELCPLDVATTLEVSGMSVDIQDVDGRTPLAWAAGRRNLTILRTLLSFGANPNSSDRLQAVPMFAAVKSGTAEMIALLLTYGADVNATDHWRNTPLHVAALRRRNNDIATILLSAGAQIDARDRSGWTPLFAAIFWGLGPMTQLLVDHGADINNKDKDGMTPLMQAIWLNNHEATDLLLQKNADASVVTKDQRSVLHFAAEYSDVRALRRLAAAPSTWNLDMNNRDARGNTPRTLFDARSDITLDLVNAFTGLVVATTRVQPLPPPLSSRELNESFHSFETAATFISFDSAWEDATDVIKQEIRQGKGRGKRKRLQSLLGRCMIM